MSNFVKKGKRALSIGVTVTTIVWTLGLAALAPASHAQTLAAGDLLQCAMNDAKCPKDRALYWFTSDGKRLTFPNEKTYKTWYEDFKSVTIKQLSFDELAAIPLAGNAAYRAGTRLGKITTDPKTYAITPGGVLRHIPSEAAAKMLYGENWAKWVDDIPDVFFGNYSAGAPLKEGELPDGMVLKAADAETLYLVDGGKKRMISDFNAFKANGYNSAYVVSTSKETLDKLAAGDAVTGAETKLQRPWTASGGAGAPPATAVAGTLEVMLGANSPAQSTLIAGQANAELMQLTFNNMGGSDMWITSLKLSRTGASTNTTLPSVYLYQGAQRLTEAATFSSTDNAVTFNETLKLPTGKTTLTVAAHILAGVSHTIGLNLASAADVKTKAGDTIAGTFPIRSPIHSIAQLTLGTVSFATTTNPSAANIDPQNGTSVWENTVTVGTNDATLKRLALRMLGSIDAVDLKNFRLHVDGVPVGDPVENLDANKYVTFDLSSKPATLKTGGRVMKMLADVKGGTSRNFQFQLKDTSDALLYDSQQPSAAILVQANSTTFSARTAGLQTVTAGSLTVTKVSTSPSGTVVRGASSAPLARYELAATGEKIKVESLRLGMLVGSATSTTVTLRNGAVFVKEEGDTDYRQAGSTTTAQGFSSNDNGTSFSFGSSVVVSPNKKMWLELRADIFDDTGTDDTAAGTVLTARMYNVASSANATRLVTGSTLDVPAASTNGNPLTVSTGTLTLAKDQSFGNQTYVAPKQGTLLCKGTLKNSGDTEDINLNTLYADFSAADDAMDASADITQVYVKYGTKMVTPRSSVSLTSLANSWSISETLKKGEQLNVEIYGDLASGSTDGSTTSLDAGDADGDDEVTLSIRADGTAAQSSTTVNTGLVTCQVITAAGAGTLTISEDNTTPIANQAVAGSTSDNGALKVKLTTSRGETMNVKDLTFYTTATAADVGVASATLWKASNSSGPWTQVGGTETFDANGTVPGFVRWTLTGDQRIAMVENSSTYLLLKPAYVSSGQGATSGLTPTFFLADLQADGSTGAMAASGTSTGTLINSTGLIVQSNSSATYATSAETLAAAVTSATATSLTTANGVTFTAGDLIFVDEDAGADWDPATEELMMVLADGGAALTVKRGVYGRTAQAAYTNGRTLFRLNNAGTNRGIVGEATTLLDTKLTLANTSTPSGSTTGGTGKEVFHVVASAALNSADPAENKATITRFDLTNTKSGSSVANMVVYPSDHLLDATYRTTCSALSATKWRCTLSTAGGTNEVVENNSRTYVVYADVGFAADGSAEFTLANLGTADTAGDTNDVLWTDGTTAQDWVDQTLKELKAASALKNPSSTSTSGTRDTTLPTISSVTITDATADNALTVGATIVIVFSEMMDPTTVGNLTPGAAAAAITDGATGDIAGVTDGTEDYIQLVGIARIGLGNTTALTAAATGAVTGALSSAGTTLTLTVTTALTLNAADGTETFLAGTATTTMTDVNSNATTAAGSNAATVAALDL